MLYIYHILKKKLFNFFYQYHFIVLGEISPIPPFLLSWGKFSYAPFVLGKFLKI